MDVRAVIEEIRGSGRRYLNEATSKQLLVEFGVAVPRSTVALDIADVETAIADLSPPFAVKVLSPDIVHKSDAGGVVLNLVDGKSVRDAMTAMMSQPRIRAAHIDGYLIEEMAPAGREVVIGAVNDDQFGPMIMVGLGGIFVEIMQDVAFRLCPITEYDARAMLDELRGARVLDGFRGATPVNKDAIIDILLKLGGENGLFLNFEGEFTELDVNPVIVSAKGAVAVDAHFILRERSVDEDRPVAQPRDTLPVLERFKPLFEPGTIAVLGASTSTTTLANTFIRRMKAFGYGGSIYPIHPNAGEVEELPCYPRLAAAPQPIDYAYIAIAADRIPSVLAEANGRVRFAQVISSGFGETEGGADLQKELIAGARAGGCRVLGPNCLGLYSPRGGVTFTINAPQQLGSVGVISQSGGLSTDIIKRGQWRGLRFSALVTIGNSADLGPVDLLEFFFADPQTKVIGLYLEDIKQGRRCFELLRSRQATKPVLILRGGRSAQGQAAAASHTGALAGDGRVWEALSKQTGCVQVATLDQFIDALLAFQLLKLRPNKPTQDVVLFGNGGGASVLAADFFADLGLAVTPFDDVTRKRLEAMQLPPGTSVANPIDTPVRTLQEEQGQVAGRILDIVYREANPDAVVMHLNLAAFVGRGDVDPIDNLIQAAMQARDAYPGRTHFLMVLRVDGSPELNERKRHYGEKILAKGIPVYDELANAAQALAMVRRIEQRFAWH